MLINVIMPTTVGILTFIGMINTASEILKARKVFIFQYFSRRGVGDKPMSCKPEVADLIPGFSIKTLSGSLCVFPS